MGQKKINLIRNIVIAVIFSLYISVCVWSIITTKSWVNKTFPGFLVIKHNYVATLYLSGWTGYQKGLKNLDKIIEADGVKVSKPKELYDLAAHKAPGTEIRYTIIRGERKITKDIPVMVFTLRDYIMCLPVAMLVGLFFIVTGLVVLYLKPAYPASWWILSSFMALAMLFGANGERCTNGVNFLPNIFMPLMGPPMVLYSFFFPVELKRRKLYSAIVIALMLATDILYVYGYFTDRHFLFFDRLYLFLVAVSILLSSAIQVYSYFSTSDQLVRQRAKVAIYGFIFSFFIMLVIYLFAIVPKRNNFFYTSIPAALMPFILGYAVAKHNLFDLDVFIRRSLSYVVLSGLAVALFFGFGIFFSMILQGLVGQSSQEAAVLSTLLIVLLFNPIKRRLDRVIEKRFFRERYEYTATIRKAGKILVSIINLSELLRQLLATVLDAMKIERGLILLKTGGDKGFRAETAVGYDSPETINPIDADHPFIRELEDGKKAVQKNDVRELQEFRRNRDVLLEMMSGLGIVLAIPVIYENRMIGMLGLGEKKSGEWYSTEDMELLTTLMIQTAVSIENARKVEELKKMVELETSYRELKKLDELKDHFLSMVSHDLRTPMTSIRGYASLLNSKAGALSEERQKHFSSIIIKESERLTRLINDLLDLQRFEAGKMHLEFRETNLVEIVKSAADSFRGAAMTKKIELHDELPQDEIRVNADPDRLAQVVSNLLSNAVKFTPEGGKITVTMETVPENGADWAKVAVRDTGPGIPKDQQERLFNKFQQLEGQDNSKERGSGLGLALVKEIVSFHNGEVGLDSEPGKGSIFSFKIKILEREVEKNA